MNLSLSILLVVLPGLLLPIINMPFRLRVAGWIYISLFPLYLYYKSIFATIPVFGIELQWATLTKDVAGLILLIVIILLAATTKPQMLSKDHWKMLLILFGFSVYFLVGSIVAGNGILKSVMGARSYTLYAFIGVAIGALLLRNSRDWFLLAHIMLTICTLVALVALVHRYINDKFLVHPEMRQIFYGKIYDWFTYEERLRSFFTSPNTLGQIMALGITLCMWFILQHGKKELKILTGSMLIILFMWVLILTKSRSAFIAAYLTSSLMVYIVRPRLLNYLVVPGVIGLFALLSYSVYGERFTNLLENPRLPLWRSYIISSLEDGKTIFTGHGVGSVGRYGTETVESNIDIAEVIEKIGTGRSVFFVDNYFIQCLYETGLIGLLMIVYAISLWWKMYRFVKVQKLTLTDRAALSLPVCLIFFVLIISLFTASLGTYPWNLIFWTSLSGMLWVSSVQKWGGA